MLDAEFDTVLQIDDVGGREASLASNDDRGGSLIRCWCQASRRATNRPRDRARRDAAALAARVANKGRKRS